jgi:hypothetical protein
MQACAPLPTQPFSVAEEKFAELVDHLQSAGAQKMTHSELERELEEKGRELLRTLLQAHLDTRGPGEAHEPVVDAEGQERTSKRLHERGLATVFGKVEMRRLGYGADGADSLHPLDGEFNLPRELYSHELRRRAAEEVAKGSYDEAVATLARSTGSAVPKRQVEELAVRAAQDFDAFYKQKSSQPASGSLLVLSFDGKGVVMRREDLRPATQKAAHKRQQRLSKRLSKEKKKRQAHGRGGGGLHRRPLRAHTRAGGRHLGPGPSRRPPEAAPARGQEGLGQSGKGPGAGHRAGFRRGQPARS